MSLNTVLSWLTFILLFSFMIDFCPTFQTGYLVLLKAIVFQCSFHTKATPKSNLTIQWQIERHNSFFFLQMKPE